MLSKVYIDLDKLNQKYFLEKYANYDTEKGSSHRKIMLYKNFRSRKEVVDCANYIFENIMNRSIGGIEYNENERLNLGASFKECEEENVVVEDLVKSFN